MANDNKEVGRFDLADIPPAPRGMPQIEVAFDIDADGILHVSAKDLSSGKEQKIRIEAQSGLKEDDIKRMLRDAELHADEDKKRREEVEVRNEADSLSFRATKALNEYKDKIPKDVADDVQSKIDAVKKALDSNDISRIKAAKHELDAHMQHIGEAMAKAQGGAGAAGPQPESGRAYSEAQDQASSFTGGGQEESQRNKGGNDNIEEAEVEIIDDDKNKNK